VVGRGGYGELYCGILDDGNAMAIKPLAASVVVAAKEKKEKNFVTELGTMGHVHHGATLTSPPSSAVASTAASTLSLISPREAD
jgi:hypothetical protein